MILSFPILTTTCTCVNLLSDIILDMINTLLRLVKWYHGTDIPLAVGIVEESKHVWAYKQARKTREGAKSLEWKTSNHHNNMKSMYNHQIAASPVSDSFWSQERCKKTPIFSSLVLVPHISKEYKAIPPSTHTALRYQQISCIWF